jgi:microcin C transport system permease protein
MRDYILRRLLLFIPTLLGIILISFAVIQILPGGPVEQAIARFQQAQAAGGLEGNVSMGGRADLTRSGLNPEQMEYLKKLYGYDKPVHVRLWIWIKRLFTFDFGESYYHHRDVVDLVIDKLPVSMSLGIATFLLTYLISIPLGILKAVRDGSRFDVWTSALVLIGYSIPGFVLGVLLIVLLGGGSFYDVFPIRGLTSPNFDELSTWGKIFDYLHHLTLPLICMSIGSFAVMTTLTKNTVLENIKSQYVQTARSKGLSEKVVLWKHVFRNSMIPLVTGFAGNFLAMFFTGSLLIETLFSLDGLGLLSYKSVIERDYPVVMANLFFFSLLFLFGNLLSDIMYVIVDPRIDFDESDS